MSETTQASHPSHKILFAQQVGEKTFWTKVGVAWPTKTGQGQRLQLDFIPNVEGSLYLFPWESEEAKALQATTAELAAEKKI